jgi:O-antigen/teichoic acid export membrane protein
LTAENGASRDVPSSNGLGAIAVVASGGVLAQTVNVAAMVFLTRLYLPKDYALWAVLITLTTMVGTVSSLRYEGAVVIIPGRADAAGLLWTCFFLSFATAGLATAALSIGPARLGIPGVGDFLYEWRYAGLALVASTGVYQGCYAWCTREGWFRLMAASTVAQIVLTAFAQIWFGLTGGAGSSGLVSGSVVGQVGGTVLLSAAVLMQSDGPLRAGISLARVKSSTLAYRRFPLYMVPYALVGNLRERLALVLFSSMAPAAQVGLYAFSNRLVSIPLGLSGNAIRPIVFRQASVGDAQSVERLVMDVLGLLEKCTVPFVLLFLWRAADIFQAAFGTEWNGAYIYAVALVLPAFVLLHTSGLDRLLDVAGRQRLALSLEASFSVISIAAVIIALSYWRSMLPVIVVQGVVTVAYNIVWLVVVFRISGLRVRELAGLGRSLVWRAATWSFALLILEAIGGSLGTQAYVALAAVYVTATLTSSLYGSGSVLKPANAESSLS